MDLGTDEQVAAAVVVVVVGVVGAAAAVGAHVVGLAVDDFVDGVAGFVAGVAAGAAGFVAGAAVAAQAAAGAHISGADVAAVFVAVEACSVCLPSTEAVAAVAADAAMRYSCSQVEIGFGAAAAAVVEAQ